MEQDKRAKEEKFNSQLERQTERRRQKREDVMVILKDIFPC